MKSVCWHIWEEEQGVLTFEWVLLLTLLVIGVVGGVAAVRDALSIELGGVSGAAVSLDQSYTVTVSPRHGLGTAFSYTTTKPLVELTRQNGTTPQTVTDLSGAK